MGEITDIHCFVGRTLVTVLVCAVISQGQKVNCLWKYLQDST